MFWHQLVTIEACSWKNSEVVVECGAQGTFPLQGTCSKGTGTSRDHRELGRGLLGKPSWSPGKALMVLVGNRQCPERQAASVVLWYLCWVDLEALVTDVRSSFAPASSFALPAVLRSAFHFQEAKSCLCGVALP